MTTDTVTGAVTSPQTAQELFLAKLKAVDQCKLDLALTKKRYLKYNTAEDKLVIESLMDQLNLLKVEATNLKTQLSKVKRQHEREEEANLESQRKQALFSIIKGLVQLDHITCVPELFTKMDRWANVYYWDPPTLRWKQDTGYLNTKFQAMLDNAQYTQDNSDSEEFNSYIQRNCRIALVDWNTKCLFKNGVLVGDYLVPNEYQFYVRSEYPFTLLTEAQFHTRADRSLLFYRFHQVTDQWEEICWWVGRCIRHCAMEYFLFFLGPPSGGKSPWARAIKNIIGKVGSDPLTKLGEKGGLATSYDKPINIDFDANMSYLINDTVCLIKQIYGDDPVQNVRLLYANSFQVRISPYMLVLTNTMPKIASGVNQDAVFKRAFLCMFNNQLEDDKDFKVMLDEPEFLDLFGSFCFWKSFETKLQNGTLCDRRAGRVKEFIKETQDVWMDSAYPVNKAIELLLHRSTNPDSEIFASQISIAVQAWFKDYTYNKLHVAVPVNLMGEITEAITHLGGDKCTREKKKAYMGVDWTKIGHDLLNKAKEILETPDPPEEVSEEQLEKQLNNLVKFVKKPK